MKQVIICLSFIIVSCRLYGQDIYEIPDTTQILLDKAVVYSFREGSEVRKLPASTSVVNQFQIERNRIESLKDLTSYVPNLFMPDYGSQLTSPIFIRGIGSRINSPSVGLYVDHIPYFDKATFDFDMFDINYIEVLRGPQGTLYGRNTMGGIINVYSLSPADYKGSFVNLSVGNYDNFKGSVSHYGSAGEKTAFSVAGNYTHDGGYYTNKYNCDKMGKTNIGSGKVRLIHQFSSSVRAELYARYEHSEQKGYPYAKLDADGNRGTINYNENSLYNRDFFATGGLLEWKTGNVVLRSTTAYSFMKDKQQIDQDFTPADICLATQKTTNNMLSEEIIIKPVTENNYQWLFGAFGFWQYTDQNVFLDFKDDAVSMGMVPALVTNDMNYDNPTYGWAVFHQSKLNNLFTDGLSFAAGVRLDGEYAKSNYTQVMAMKQNGTEVSKVSLDSKLDFLTVMPKFTVNYTPQNTSHQIYGSIAKGYKTGGFNSAPEDLKDATFNPEYSWNYEAGVKLNLWNGILLTEASAFYINWRDQQIYQFNPSGVGSILRNAGKSESKGFELTAKLQPLRLLSLTVAYGYTHATFKDYVNIKGDVVTDYGGNYIPYVPRNTLSGNAVYTIYFDKKELLNSMEFSLQYIGAGGLYWDESNVNKQSFYNQFNARVSFDITSFAKIAVWAQNIFDTNYQTFYFEALGNSFVQYNKPFLVGVDLKFSIK